MSGRKRVLIVEDDDAIRQLVSDLLSEAGYEVQTATGGKEGLDRAKKTPPDLILLDRVMPEGDGTTFATTYARTRGKRAPIVALCAARDVEGWARAIGAVAHVVKPFDIEDLLDTVARHAR